MRIRIRIRIWIRNPGGGDLQISISPALSFFLFFPISLSTTVCSPLLLSSFSPISPSFLLLSFSLSLFPLENNCNLSSSLPSYFSSFFYLYPFLHDQTVTKQMLATTTCSPPLSPPSSSPYLLLISFLSNITDYHCCNGDMDLPPPPHNEWGGGGEKGLVSLSPT